MMSYRQRRGVEKIAAGILRRKSKRSVVEAAGVDASPYFVVYGHCFDSTGVCVRCGCGKTYAIHYKNECEGKNNVVWLPFPQIKPQPDQICIVAAGPGRVAQHLALRWDDCQAEFVWAQDIGLAPFPTEEATHWMAWPDDPFL
jgi:hypothetical protein